MQRGKAFAVVGHKNWGKSKTLEALVGGTQVRKYKINSTKFFVRHTSNDDVKKKRPNAYIDFVSKCDPSTEKYQRLILALCPEFKDERAKTVEILDALKKKYKLYFFVLKHNAKGNGDTISAEEIARLKKYGEVHLYIEKRLGEKTKKNRAKEFRTFIKENL